MTGDQLKGREFSSAEGSSNLGGPWTFFLEKFYCCRGRRGKNGGAYLVRYGNKGLKDKDNSNEIVIEIYSNSIYSES